MQLPLSVRLLKVKKDLQEQKCFFRDYFVSFAAGFDWKYLNKDIRLLKISFHLYYFSMIVEVENVLKVTNTSRTFKLSSNAKIINSSCQFREKVWAYIIFNSWSLFKTLIFLLRCSQFIRKTFSCTNIKF